VARINLEKAENNLNSFARKRAFVSSTQPEPDLPQWKKRIRPLRLPKANGSTRKALYNQR
jgi:hypothetical protein